MCVSRHDAVGACSPAVGSCFSAVRRVCYVFFLALLSAHACHMFAALCVCMASTARMAPACILAPACRHNQTVWTKIARHVCLWVTPLFFLPLRLFYKSLSFLVQTLHAPHTYMFTPQPSADNARFSHHACKLTRLRMCVCNASLNLGIIPLWALSSCPNPVCFFFCRVGHAAQ